jgi:hypothetical protein
MSGLGLGLTLAFPRRPKGELEPQGGQEPDTIYFLHVPAHFILDKTEKHAYVYNGLEIIRITSVRPEQLGKRLQILGKWMHKEERTFSEIESSFREYTS